jgi:hypothetical protein
VGKKPSQNIIEGKDVTSIGFAAVPYPGQGKYDVSSDRLPERAVRWEELSEKVDQAELNVGKFDRLIDDGHHKQGAWTTSIWLCATPAHLAVVGGRSAT